MREMPHVGCISQYGIEYYTKHKLFCSVSNKHDTLIRSVLLVCVDLQQSLRQSLVYAFLPPLQTPHSPLSTRHHHRSNGRKMRLKTPVWNSHGLSCELRTMCALSGDDTQAASLGATCQIEQVEHFQSLHHPIFEIPQKWGVMQHAIARKALGISSKLLIAKHIIVFPQRKGSNSDSVEYVCVKRTTPIHQWLRKDECRKITLLFSSIRNNTLYSR